MSNDEPPLHHFPSVQGMHQTAQPEAADPWELFFGLCWDWWEVVQQRRAERQQDSTTSNSNVPAQEAGK